MVVEISVDHFQFFIGDRLYGPKEDTSALWSGSGLVQSGRFLVGITTARYGGPTNVSIEVIRQPATASSWDWMGDFALEVPTGELALWAPELEDIARAPTIAVGRGTFKGMAMSRKTETVSDEMALSGDDEYKLLIWRQEALGD